MTPTTTISTGPGTRLATVAPSGIIASAGTVSRSPRDSSDDFLGSVVTHSVPVIQLMLNRGSGRVVGLGGDVLPESQAFVGPMTVDAAAGLRVRTLFLGAAAVDDRGVYVATDIERPTKQAQIATVVTDQRPTRSISDQLTRTGVDLRVPTEP
jgi:hypothetical protein